MTTLPQRRGTRPRTTDDIPHSQLDQQPADTRHLDAVLVAASTWPGITQAPSGISVEGARALVLDGQHAGGPDEAFLVGGEFAHGHAQGDHSLHVTLPLDLAAQAEAAGWAEPHLWVHTGALPGNVVMLYAPRDAEEAAITLRLVRAAYEFAGGPAASHPTDLTPADPADHHHTEESR